jgi:hypothetical protein
VTGSSGEPPREADRSSAPGKKRRRRRRGRRNARGPANVAPATADASSVLRASSGANARSGHRDGSASDQPFRHAKCNAASGGSARDGPEGRQFEEWEAPSDASSPASLSASLRKPSGRRSGSTPRRVLRPKPRPGGKRRRRSAATGREKRTLSTALGQASVTVTQSEQRQCASANNDAECRRSIQIS